MQQLSSLSNKELWNTMMASAIKSNSPRQFTATYSLLCGEARGGRGGGERRGDGKRGVFKCLARGKIRQRLDLRPLNEESNLLNIWTPWLLRKIIFNEQWKVLPVLCDPFAFQVRPDYCRLRRDRCSMPERAWNIGRQAECHQYPETKKHSSIIFTLKQKDALKSKDLMPHRERTPYIRFFLRCFSIKARAGHMTKILHSSHCIILI